MEASGRVLFVDLQEGLIDAVRTQDAGSVRRGASAMADIAGTLGLPCCISGVPAAGGAAPMINELRVHPAVPDLTVRRSFGALGDMAVRDWAITAEGPLLLAGIVTEGAVLATVLEARELGLVVEVMLDACSGLSPRTEDAAIRQIEAAGARTTSIVSWVARRRPDFGDPAGKAVMASLGRLLT